MSTVEGGLHVFWYIYSMKYCPLRFCSITLLLPGSVPGPAITTVKKTNPVLAFQKCMVSFVYDAGFLKNIDICLACTIIFQKQDCIYGMIVILFLNMHIKKAREKYIKLLMGFSSDDGSFFASYISILTSIWRNQPGHHRGLHISVN